MTIKDLKLQADGTIGEIVVTITSQGASSPIKGGKVKTKYGVKEQATDKYEVKLDIITDPQVNKTPITIGKIYTLKCVKGSYTHQQHGVIATLTCWGEYKEGGVVSDSQKAEKVAGNSPATPKTGTPASQPTQEQWIEKEYREAMVKAIITAEIKDGDYELAKSRLNDLYNKVEDIQKEMARLDAEQEQGEMEHSDDIPF